MKIKANPQGHKRGVGEVRTRAYTDIGWRSNDRSGTPRAAPSFFRIRPDLVRANPGSGGRRGG